MNPTAENIGVILAPKWRKDKLLWTFDDRVMRIDPKADVYHVEEVESPLLAYAREHDVLIAARFASGGWLQFDEKGAVQFVAGREAEPKTVLESAGLVNDVRGLNFLALSPDGKHASIYRLGVDAEILVVDQKGNTVARLKTIGLPAQK